MLGSACQVIAYTIQAPAPPFPLFVIAFAINGFGIGLQVNSTIFQIWIFWPSFQDAQANGYVASYEEGAETKMGIMHAVYGKPFTSESVHMSL